MNKSMLYDPQVFEQRFIELTSEYPTYEEAYLAVEKEFHSVYKKFRYSGYDSFRKVRHKKIKIRSGKV